MYRRAFLLTIVAIVGVAVGVLGQSMFASGPSPEQRSPDGDKRVLVHELLPGEPGELSQEQLARVVEALVQTVDEEIRERDALAAQIESLQSELTDLQEHLRSRVTAAFEEQRTAALAAAEASGSPPGSEDRFARAGITPRQMEFIRRLEAQAEMRQIEVDDRARREGWINTQRYFAEANRLQTGGDTVRKELGDDAYDRYLYAANRSNRIAVTSVIPTSPAERAGFQAGDRILTYGGERIFTPQQMIDLRSSGELGAPVTVEVMRNGQLVQITMPRGRWGPR